jgi:solute carrier family 8 (sodium/calcium exchanger)
MVNPVAERIVSDIFKWTNGSVCHATPAPYGEVWKQWQQDLESDCCGGQGDLTMLMPAIPRSPVLAIVYILLLFYIFMGVALGAEVFMMAIEVVTAKEITKRTTDADGKEKIYHVRVWNATVANLTLMALGSSAPEILLNVIEVLAGGFNAGALGPSTIVGSAAFNLMVITAVCIVCLPPGEKRTLKQLGVFLTTAFYSVLAYVWLFLMVIVFTPEVITVAEGVITCVLLLILIVQAYITDKRSTAIAQQKYVGMSENGKKGQPTKSEAAAAVKAVGLGKDATPEDIKEALAEELLPPKSKAYYRKQANSAMGTGKGTDKGTSKVAPEGPLAGEPARAKTAVEADDIPPPADANAPGTIKWAQHAVDVMESAGTLKLEVERVAGSKGEITCTFATKNQKAVAGKDYGETSGTLTWADGDTSKKFVSVDIYDDDEFEKDEEFTVVLSDPTAGATFFRHTDGGDDNDVCTVVIKNDDDRATRLVEAIRMLRLDADALDLATDDWVGALKDCFIPPNGAGAKEMVMHVLMFPWKLMFAICPPAGLCGGYPCFVISLAFIGFQVVLISDFANQVGCQLYIKTAVTAITFVALGTSLPDTFASMQAARGDKYADNSVGNVTGSNSVNVFFGLGVPWLMGAIYWASAGANEAWELKFGPLGTTPLPSDLYALYGGPGGSGAFVVRKGDLGLSVIVFIVCAIITIGLILARRQMGGELGGNRQGAIASGIFLVFLWFVYVIVSSLSTYGIIVANL